MIKPCWQIYARGLHGYAGASARVARKDGDGMDTRHRRGKEDRSEHLEGGQSGGTTRVLTQAFFNGGE